MKYLITGANGLLGQKLVALLRSKPEIECIATGRGVNRNPPGEDYVYHTMDITVPDNISSAFDLTQPDVVIHTAAMTQVDQCEHDREDCWKQNVDAVGHIAEACNQHGSFLIHLSTDFIFDGAAGPYKEEDAPNPQSYYAESKLASEDLIKVRSSQWAIVRTILVYGITPSMSRPNIILWVKDSLEKGKPIQVVNDQWRMPTLAEDLAMGCFLIGQKRAEGIFHISGKDMVTPYDIAIATADFFELDKSLITEVDASVFTQPAKRPARTGFVLDKARAVLGYEPRSLTEGLAILKEQLPA